MCATMEKLRICESGVMSGICSGTRGWSMAVNAAPRNGRCRTSAICHESRVNAFVLWRNGLHRPYTTCAQAVHRQYTLRRVNRACGGICQFWVNAFGLTHVACDVNRDAGRDTSLTANIWLRLVRCNDIPIRASLIHWRGDRRLLWRTAKSRDQRLRRRA
jgi:hypothetical protein